MMRSHVFMLALLIPQSLFAALSGSLESRFQYNDYFHPGAYLEQWVTLDYRERGGPSGGLLASLGGMEGHAWADIHRLYLLRRLADTGLDITAGRMERIDASGMYSLDGLSLDGRNGGYGWELYAGAPARTDYYVIPNPGDDSLDEPPGRRLLGMQVTRRLVADDAESTTLGLGLRRYWLGVDAWRLDGRIAGTWRPSTEWPVYLNGSLSLDPDAGVLERFDIQARLPDGDRGQFQLRARRYEPPQDPVTFRDRYYRFYARGPQTVVEAGYTGRPRYDLEWSANLRGIQRGTGTDGMGADLSMEWKSTQGTLLEGRADWLRADDEYLHGLYGGVSKPLNSRLLLTIGAAVRGERSRLEGDSTVLAGEARLEWMWQRDLQLQALLELARVDGDYESYDQLRFGLRLVYRLPGLYPEDYR